MRQFKNKLVILLVLLFVSLLLAKKTDIVYLQNGDRITCEIKKLELGQLTVKTDDFGKVMIKWKSINKIISKNYFELEMTDGTKYYGYFPDSRKNGVTRVFLYDSSYVDLKNDQIVRINQILEQFISRINVNIDIGFDMTKANKLAKLTLGGNTNYRDRKNYYSSTTNAVFTHQQDSIQNERFDVDFRYNRFFKNRWFLEGYTTVQHNSELGLDLRILAGGGPGKNIIQTNENTLSALIGLVANREWNQGIQSSSNLEGWVRVEYKRFIYISPKVDIQAQVEFFPNMTTPGRNRVELYAYARQEIVKDLYLGFTYQYSFDSRNPTSGTKESDWVFSFVFGWTL